MHAAEANRFNHITTDHGLKSSLIRTIIKSRDGFVWIGGYKGLYRFDGHALKTMKMPNGLHFNEVRFLAEDPQGVVWIATRADGIFYLQQGVMAEFAPPDMADWGEFQVMFQSKQGVWLVFSERLIQLAESAINQSLKITIDEPIHSGVETHSGDLLLGTTQAVLQITTADSQPKTVEVQSSTPNRAKHVLHQDDSGVIWLGRSDGLYVHSPACDCFVNRHDLIQDVDVYALESDQDTLWVGATMQGLYAVDLETEKVRHFQSEKHNVFGLSDNSVISIHRDFSDGLWLGTFNHGVNFVDLNAFDFGRFSSADFNLGCLPSDVVYDLFEAAVDTIWVATDQGISVINLETGACEQLRHDPDDPRSISGQHVYSFFPTAEGLWVTGSGGTDAIDLKDHTVQRLPDPVPQIDTYFVASHGPGTYLMGTRKGVHHYDANSAQSHVLEITGEGASDQQFYLHQKGEHGVYLGSHDGLFLLQDNQLQRLALKSKTGTVVKNITGMRYDPQDGLLVAADSQFLLQVTPSGEVIDHSALVNDLGFDALLFDVLKDRQGVYWVSSDHGLYQIDLARQKAHNHLSSDGLQGNDFLKISSHQGQSGKLYFGGRQGFNAFYPEHIGINETPPQVVITKLLQLNQEIGMGQQTMGGFTVSKPIEQVSHLTLNHRDLAIGFEFVALDHADSARNQYAYRMLGFNEVWQHVGAADRHANYTNLKPGDYQFQVKAANKDGVWNQQPRTLAITVLPAPWFSTWAYAAYVLIVLSSIAGFIRLRTRAARLRAEHLEVTVTERTQDVLVQKKMVESLLDHKNAVFANVTHEFKTPLALILGPAEQMADHPDLTAHAEPLAMIKRNANRLLLMVGQILKLSEAEQDQDVIREVQAVQPTLLMLFESFMPLAQDKGIRLTLDNDQDVTVYATRECLVTVVGNLLSNALKYTDRGGAVSVRSAVTNGRVLITVEDTGSGIKPEHLSQVFNRFVRLDDHRSIQGTGIGLAVVKEVTEANQGHVEVNSTWGEGSRFTVGFPISEMATDGSLSEAMASDLVRGLDTEISAVIAEDAEDTVVDDQGVSVLIIEDNLDMQAHIVNVLKKRFTCQVAARGKQGVAMAFELVPDVIVCDVMMPGMDGYQVTRIVRQDPRTSHIPVVLLTALNSTESRIKGWRENIDRYITKPFDALELNAQLDNILTVRALLQNQTAQAVDARSELEQLGLSKQDIQFIEQLKAVIADLHANEYIQKADLAAKMALSERQLQRKVKGLLGVGPLDLLRDHRLVQAQILLKEGWQVSQVSDRCGFSSVSYFGACFKKKYGVTPKQYQQL